MDDLRSAATDADDAERIQAAHDNRQVERPLRHFVGNEQKSNSAPGKRDDWWKIVSASLHPFVLVDADRVFTISSNCYQPYAAAKSDNAK